MSDDRNVEMANLTIYSAVGKVQRGISRNTSLLSILDIIFDIDTGLSRETKLFIRPSTLLARAHASTV